MNKPWASSFRTLVRAIRQLPEQRRFEARVMARQEFRRGTQMEQMESRVESALQYIALLSPRRGMNGTTQRGGGGGGGGGKTTYVERDGQLVRVGSDGGGKKEAVGIGRCVFCLVRVQTRENSIVHTSRDQTVSSADYKRHFDLVKRQHFGGRR